ncbi:type VI secretion system contractile sheath small subunit, partial [Escherichia coli]|nr:type VI secretion system contractile sheath small subunit [Escherichia coli]
MNRLCPVISIPEMGEISFRSMDDFHPDGLFEKLPVFTHLRDLRRRLKDSDSYNSAAREARRLFGLAGEEISVNTQSQQPTAEGG